LGYLHNYVHSKGVKFSNKIGIQKSNFQTFQEQGIKAWFESFREVIEVLSILHLVKYPLGIIELDYDSKFGLDQPMFGGLDPDEIYRIKAIVDDDAIHAMEEVARSDETVKSITESVSNMPDLTQEEFDEQIIEFDKDMINNQGFEVWLGQEKAALGDKFAISEKQKQRVELLRKWAKDNGYEKPAWER
jgi:hypothetical protein